jgi:hypothetical protein
LGGFCGAKRHNTTFKTTARQQATVVGSTHTNNEKSVPNLTSLLFSSLLLAFPFATACHKFFE